MMPTFLQLFYIFGLSKSIAIRFGCANTTVAKKIDSAGFDD